MNRIVQSLFDNICLIFYLTPYEKNDGRKMNPLSTEFMIYMCSEYSQNVSLVFILFGECLSLKWNLLKKQTHWHKLWNWCQCFHNWKDSFCQPYLNLETPLSMTFNSRCKSTMKSFSNYICDNPNLAQILFSLKVSWTL